MRRQLLSSADAVPATGQHTEPCSDCPWARASLPGWLGEMTADEWLATIHSPGEVVIDCHVHAGAQCAGSLIYRANVLKRSRPGSPVPTLPKDKELVFATPKEFKEHHEGGSCGRKKADD